MRYNKSVIRLPGRYLEFIMMITTVELARLLFLYSNIWITNEMNSKVKNKKSNISNI